ncbi:MAG: serine protease [Gammaproteobacteria bacterium]|nr:serine protease [Gammaproteobacteria bacterium]
MKKNLIITFCLLLISNSVLADLPETLKKIKPSVVGVGTLEQTRRPPAQLLGTGFAVGNGKYVITNAHVIPNELNAERLEKLIVFIGIGKKAKAAEVELVERDRVHDLALLKLKGGHLPPMQLGYMKEVEEGKRYAFTGFPIGSVLGIYPVTHHGIVSAISPIAIPQSTGQTLDAVMIKRLRDPYDILQLDATAYPGNSGSALYDTETGRVVGVINKVFVKETKETVLEKPSGITYAIPVTFVRELLLRNKIPF